MTYNTTTYKHTTALGRWVKKMVKYKAILGVICLLVGLGYFWQTNSLSTRGYQIRELEKSIDLLKEKNQELELQAASAQSWETLQERVKQLNMVETDHVEYLTPAGGSVALK